MVLAIKLPGAIAKWSSSGGIYGPLQGYCSSAATAIAAVDAAFSGQIWEPRHFRVVAVAVADSVAASVLSWVVSRTTEQPGKLLPATATNTASSLPASPAAARPSWGLIARGHYTSWTSLAIAASALTSVLCVGHDLYAIPWVVAALLVAATRAEDHPGPGEAAAVAQMKQL